MKRERAIGIAFIAGLVLVVVAFVVIRQVGDAREDRERTQDLQRAIEQDMPATPSVPAFDEAQAAQKCHALYESSDISAPRHVIDGTYKDSFKEMAEGLQWVGVEVEGETVMGHTVTDHFGCTAAVEAGDWNVQLT